MVVDQAIAGGEAEGVGERPLAELAAEITGAAVRLAAATAAWLLLIAEFVRRQGWAGPGISSCAHWLGWQCGLAPSTAREHVRVARALTGLPHITAAFAAGRISYAKVRALTRVADPACEADLLELALHTTASQVERVVRAWRRSEAPDTETLSGQQKLEYWWDDDGMLVFRGRAAPEVGAALVAAIESVVERDVRRERAAARREAGTAGAPVEPGSPADDALRRADEADELAAARKRRAARRVDALAALAAAVADADRRAGDPPRREVVLHVDAAVLAAGQAHLEGGPPLSRPQVLRMACEATAVVMLESGGEPLAVGRRRRYATRAQRRALMRRDRGCARPGCNENRVERLHAHHLRHWLFGGRTDLPNLVLLCDRDHGLAHDLDLVMTRRDGRLLAVTPDGQRVWGAADAAFAGGITGLTGLADRPDADIFAGVAPLDGARGRRPATDRTESSETDSATAEPPPGDRSLSSLLFPHGEPRLTDTMAVGGERMDLRYVVGVLMTNRELTRRLAEQHGVAVAA